MNSMPEPTENIDRINDTRRDDCPEWCTFDHREDDARDDLVLHQGGEHHPGERFAPTGDRLSIQVSRTDCPPEGRIGTPALAVRGELYLETWEQAAELAHAILDAFGYLAGADKA